MLITATTSSYAQFAMRTSQGSRLSLAGLNDDLTIAQAQRTEAALLSPRARAVRLWILLSLLLEAQKLTIRGGKEEMNMRPSWKRDGEDEHESYRAQHTCFDDFTSEFEVKPRNDEGNIREIQYLSAMRQS